MIDLSKAEIKGLTVHIVGNKLRQEGLELSKGQTAIGGDRLAELLYQHFLKPFATSTSWHHFAHNSNLSFNEAYVYSKSIFSNHGSLLDVSTKLAHHLYENSVHPRIRRGEFFTLHVSNCNVDGTVVDAIGIFKAENKDTYFKVSAHENAYQIGLDEGISIHRMEKGCLIFNVDSESGYRLLVIDNHSKTGDEARYWKGQFLGVRELQTADSTTNKYIHLVKRVIDDSFSDMAAEDRIKAQMKSIKYFESNSQFNSEQFAREVFSDWPQATEQYKEHRRKFQDDEGVGLPDTFDISNDAVERAMRTVKNIIRLDSNFEIIVKTNEAEAFKNLERDYDQNRGMSYYKVYFVSEQ